MTIYQCGCGEFVDSANQHDCPDQVIVLSVEPPQGNPAYQDGYKAGVAAERKEILQMLQNYSLRILPLEALRSVPLETALGSMRTSLTAIIRLRKEKQPKSTEATNRDRIRGWITVGQRAGATHMIIVCDTFSHEDYPVFVGESEDVRKKADEYDHRNMQKIMEVYNFSLDLEAQVESDARVRNY